MTAGPMVNGGTGDYTVSAALFAASFVLVPLLLLWLQDQVSSWRARRAHRRVVLRALAAVSPVPCRVCGDRGGWHQQGCGLLDRLDAQWQQAGR